MTEESLQPLIEHIVDKLNSVQTDGHWHIGKIVSETITEYGGKRKPTVFEVCRELATHPQANLTYSYLQQCVRTFHYYPDISKRELPEALYHVLANRVYHKEDRDRFEKLAIINKWNSNSLAAEIRKELVSRKEQAKSELGFDLQITNLWYFNTSDPRFGKSSFRGRVAGQIVANALYYFAGDEGLIVDLFAGSGTLGDVVDKLPYFRSRKYEMFDLNPADDRIKANDVIVKGIPLRTKTVSYIFLDPPYLSLGERYYGSSPSDLSRMAPEAFMAVMSSVVRECWRVLLPSRNVSLIIEPFMPFDSPPLDLPFLLGNKFVEVGFELVSKVYIPNQTMRNESAMPNIISQARGKRKLISDCRELLTFRKPK